MGLGQFEINIEDLRRINEIDNQIVKLLENQGNNQSIGYEFKKQLELLDKMVQEKGIAIDSKEILPSERCTSKRRYYIRRSSYGV